MPRVNKGKSQNKSRLLVYTLNGLLLELTFSIYTYILNRKINL